MSLPRPDYGLNLLDELGAAALLSQINRLARRVTEAATSDFGLDISGGLKPDDVAFLRRVRAGLGHVVFTIVEARPEYGNWE